MLRCENVVGSLLVDRCATDANREVCKETEDCVGDTGLRLSPLLVETDAMIAGAEGTVVDVKCPAVVGSGKMR